MDRRRRRYRDDDDYYEDEQEERYERYGAYQKTTPIIPFLIVGAVVVGIGMIVILTASKNAQERQARATATSTKVMPAGNAASTGWALSFPVPFPN